MSQTLWNGSTGPRPRHTEGERLARGLVACLVVGFATNPASAQMLVGDGSVQCGVPYVVERRHAEPMAARVYGDPMLYGFIAEANWEGLLAIRRT